MVADDFVRRVQVARGRGDNTSRPGEPMLQILILPATSDFTLVPMDDEEAAEREMRGVESMPAGTRSPQT